MVFHRKFNFNFAFVIYFFATGQIVRKETISDGFGNGRGRMLFVKMFRPSCRWRVSLTRCRTCFSSSSGAVPLSPGWRLMYQTPGFYGRTGSDNTLGNWTVKRFPSGGNYSGSADRRRNIRWNPKPRCPAVHRVPTKNIL